MNALSGKVALVTGAGKNIGREVALVLARDGASVAVNGRSDKAAVDAVVAEIIAEGGKAVSVMGDVSKEADVQRLVDEACEAFGGLDVVVSNAGLRRQTPLLDMSYDEWREILSVALDGAFLLSRATVPSMMARGGGAFIGISGISHQIGTLNRCHVSASKAGLEGLMRSLAMEMAPHNITFNCVAPGATDTVRGASAGPMPGIGRDANIPLGRKATVGEIAAMVRHLASLDGRYITGQTIHVNGGLFLH